MLHESDNSSEIRKMFGDKILTLALPQCTQIYE